jgi:threonine dehydratase
MVREALYEETGPVDLVDEVAVRALLQPHIRPTTFVSSENLSAALGADVVLAVEAFQHTGAFKFRAAMAAALHATGGHLLAASSGNFGAALALAAKKTGKRCTIVMPDRSVPSKIAAVRSHGAEVDLIDTRVIPRKTRIAELERTIAGAQVISAYDDAFVIAGNASLGFEILEADKPDAIIAGIGGGGLTSGLIKARNAVGAKSEVWAAEPAAGNDAARSLRAGVLSSNDEEPDTICDGARTLSLGQRNFAILRRGLAGVVEVPDAVVEQAMRLLFQHANVKAEPTGALGVGALLVDRARFAGKRVVCVVSGGNADPALYARIVSQPA